MTQHFNLSDHVNQHLRCTDEDHVFIDVDWESQVLPKPQACLNADPHSPCVWEFCGYAFYTQRHGKPQLQYKMVYFATAETLRYYFQDAGAELLPYLWSWDPHYDFHEVQEEQILVKSAAKL